jgi:hypothetical protein
MSHALALSQSKQPCHPETAEPLPRERLPTKDLCTPRRRGAHRTASDRHCLHPGKIQKENRFSRTAKAAKKHCHPERSRGTLRSLTGPKADSGWINALAGPQDSLDSPNSPEYVSPSPDALPRHWHSPRSLRRMPSSPPAPLSELPGPPLPRLRFAS